MKKKSSFRTTIQTTIQTTIGRRKTAIARVRFKKGSGKIICNGKSLETYFMRKSLVFKVKHPLEVTGQKDSLDIIARIDGSGLSAQGDALSLAIARALLLNQLSLKPLLRKNGLLTRDARKVQRKMYGHKKARKSFQFSKR